MDEALHVLLLDDNPNDRLWIADGLTRELPGITIEAIAGPALFSAALDRAKHTLVVTESVLHWGNGIRALTLARKRRPSIPVIMFTAAGNEEMAVEAMKAGLNDYIQKSRYNIPRLAHAIRNALERLRAEEALRESRRALDTLMSNLPGMVYRCRNDDQWTMLFVSEGCGDLTGYRADDLVGNRTIAYADLIHPDDRGDVSRSVLDAVDARGPFRISYRIRTASGNDRWVWEHGRGVYDERGNLEAIEGVIMDATVQRDADKRLDRAHAIYRKAIQNARGIPYELHFHDGRYGFFAEGIEAILGRKVDQLTQKEFESYIEEIVITDSEAPDSRFDYQGKFLNGEIERWLADYRIRGADGETRWVSDCATPIRDEATGKVIGSLGILNDITERRGAEERTREDNRFLTTLSGISRALSCSRTPEELSEALARDLRGIVPLDAFYMEAFHAGTGHGYGLGNFDTIDGVFQRVPFIRAESNRRKGPLGPTVYEGRRPLVINRSSEELARKDQPLVAFGDTARRSASLVYVPLIMGERIIGVMSAQSYSPNAYGKAEIDLLVAIAAHVAPAVEGVLLGHQLRRSSETLRSIVTGTSSTTGTDFFRSLVRHLASTFGVKYALLGEIVGPDRDRVRALALWTGETYLENREFARSGTFIGDVEEQGVRYCPRGARTAFPDDPILRDFSVESCMGISLRDSSDQALGVLEVLHTQGMDDDLDLESVLKVFAARAGVELERIRAEEALRRSEEKYRNLFENAQVGMFRSRLEDGLVLEANQQMGDLLGIPRQDVRRRELRSRDLYVDPSVRERMVRIIREQGEVDNFEARFQRRDGRVVWIQYSAKLYRDQGYLEGIAFDITPRKEIEHALREANETLQAVVQASPLAIIGFDLNQRVLMWNPAAERIFGWSREELLGSQTSILPELEFDNFSALRKQGDREKGFSGLELRRRRKDGAEIDISLSMAPLRDTNGRVTGAVSIISDITEKKRLEVERETFAWLSLQLVEIDTLDAMGIALSQALDILFRFDSLYFAQRSPGRDPFMPVRAMDWIGGERRLVQGHVRILADYEGLGRLVEGEPFLLNRRGDDERPLQRFGDETRPSASLLFAPVLFRGEVFGIISVQSYQRDRYDSRDLHLLKAVADMVAPALRRVQAEGDLRRSEARNRALLGALPDAIFLLDSQGTFRDYNASRDQLFVAPERFMGKRIDKVLPADLARLTLDIMQRALETGAAQNLEYQLPVDGQLREFEARMIPCGADEILVIVRDIAERKNLETQLRQAQKMEAVGRLAGGIAHDFNNLLTGIVGNLGIAQMEAPPDVQPLLEEAMRASQRAAGLVSQLLAFGRKSIVSIQPTDLAPILKEVVGIVKNTFDRRIEILLRRDPALRSVLGDAGQIHQVLLNLLVNARDALSPYLGSSPERPLRITLDANNFDVGEEYSAFFSYARPGAYVVLSVTDTGIGMDEETRKQVFEPFFTTKELGKGTGLGLATVYGIVKQHNGWIKVYSEPERGSTFRVYLPAGPDEPDGAGAKDGQDGAADILPMPGGPETILVVDDEAYIRRLSRRILEPLGYKVVEAADGEKAMETLRRADLSVDLVLLDLSMPRMSGQETSARIHEMGLEVKVILSSGYAHIGDLPEHMGALEYISKPYRPAELAQIIRKVLDS